MKSKWIRRMLGGVLALVLVLGCVGTAGAFVPLPIDGESKREYLTGTSAYPGGIYAVMGAKTRSDVRSPIRSTQAEHVKGATLTLTLEKGTTFGLAASASFEVSSNAELSAGIAKMASIAFSGNLAVALGITGSVSFTTTTVISYTLDENMAPGFYRLTEVFPVKALELQVIGYDANGNAKILTRKSIDYAPKLEDAYITLERFDPYAD